MKYTKAQQAQLKANPYTYKVTDSQLSFTADFKRDFWNSYQAGHTPREIMKELGYDLKLLTQKQIDGFVQRLKKQAAAGEFHDGAAPRRRKAAPARAKMEMELTEENFGRLWTEVKYLRQEVDFIKRILPTAEVKGER